jgi:hypothetical protein
MNMSLDSGQDLTISSSLIFSKQKLTAASARYFQLVFGAIISFEKGFYYKYIK